MGSACCLLANRFKATKYSGMNDGDQHPGWANMKIRPLAICYMALACGGCSLLRPSCDSPGVLADVRQMIAGLKETPSSDGASWLEKNIEIVVVSQGVDQSGNQIKCEANATVSDALFKQAGSFLGIISALTNATGKNLNSVTVHYSINFKPYSISRLSTSLAPASDQEAEHVQLFATILQPVYQKALAGPAIEKVVSQPVNTAASADPKNPSTTEAGQPSEGSALASAGPLPGEFGAYIGKDQCAVADQQNNSARLKGQFIQLFGEEVWQEWKGYGPGCGEPPTTFNDAVLGTVIILERLPNTRGNDEWRSCNQTGRRSDWNLHDLG